MIAGTIMVLNMDFSFLHNTSVRNGLRLIQSGKAEKAMPNVESFILKSFNAVFEVPTVIRLLKFIRKMYKGHIDPRKKNIYIRDRFICCYCNARINPDKCTADHITPRSRGGLSTWENMVTSCSRCNAEKRNRTPKEAGMTMHYHPFQPTVMEFLKIRLELLGVNDMLNNLLKGCV